MKTVRHIFFEHVRYTVKGQIFQEVGCMTEFVIIGTFAVLLIIGTVLSVPLIYTLLMGFALFFSYGISRSISAKALLRSAAKSIPVRYCSFCHCRCHERRMASLRNHS